ncbi:MAG: hypothetical protein ABIJ09_26185 [Pseudomonadota bacterium]
MNRVEAVLEQELCQPTQISYQFVLIDVYEIKPRSSEAGLKKSTALTCDLAHHPSEKKVVQSTGKTAGAAGTAQAICEERRP